MKLRLTSLPLWRLREILLSPEEIACEEFHELSQKEQKKKRMEGAIPRDCARNEIGLIFYEGEKEAETDLVQMLDDPENSSLAYYYLSQLRDRLSEEATYRLEVFEKDPENLRAIDDAEDEIDSSGTLDEQFNKKR